MHRDYIEDFWVCVPPTPILKELFFFSDWRKWDFFQETSWVNVRPWQAPWMRLFLKKRGFCFIGDFWVFATRWAPWKRLLFKKETFFFQRDFWVCVPPTPMKRGPGELPRAPRRASRGCRARRSCTCTSAHRMGVPRSALFTSLV
jgi:hypothetical protein